MAAGFPPGAVLVFLITGPATNAATIAAMGRLLGTRSTVIYLLCLVGTAVGAGLLLDALHTALPSTVAHCAAGETSPSLFQHFCAAVLIALLIFARAVKR